jgi:hypothetical protein
MNDTSAAVLPVTQLILRVPPALSETILAHTQATDPDIFSAAMQIVSATLKFRPAIWKTWPKARQREWLWTNLRQARFATTAREILQEWFFGQRAAMLNEFLDSFGIAHDEHGHVEGDLPETFDTEKVRATVETLLQKFNPEEVALYLHLFQHGRANGWTSIATILSTDARLGL